MRPILFLLVILSYSLTGCKNQDSSTVTKNGDRVYEVRGQIVEADREGHILHIAHEDIPGLMPAMTMPFKVADAEDINRLSSGNVISFRLIIGEQDSWIKNLTLLSDETIPTKEVNEEQPPVPAPESIYQHNAAWTNQDGNTVRLSTFAGKPVVISMIFTRCGYACPRIVQDMKEIAGQLPEHLRSEVQYVLVSFDTEHDTPERLRLFARAHHIESETWTLLQGRDADVRMLAAMLGIRYKSDENGLFSHTNLITILNEKGEIINHQKGLGTDPDDSVDTLVDLFAIGT